MFVRGGSIDDQMAVTTTIFILLLACGIQAVKVGWGGFIIYHPSWSGVRRKAHSLKGSLIITRKVVVVVVNHNYRILSFALVFL